MCKCLLARAVKTSSQRYTLAANYILKLAKLQYAIAFYLDGDQATKWRNQEARTGWG